MINQVSNLMESTRECFTVLIDDTIEIAADFQSGNPGRAMEKLLLYIDNLLALIKAIDTLQANNAGLMIKGTALSSVLLQMEQAMINKDYVLLADLLEYEIKEVLLELQSSVKE